MNQERVKRKLSAILSADVAGYSRLMGEDEVSTVRTLEAYRKVMSDLIEQFRGRVVDSPGDNLLSEFSSVVDAVQCAVEIHEVIRAKNEELPEDRRMLFRIGVNLGDVIEEADRIYGDGVNIAARLEGLAEAGGICISGSAHEQIENKLALGYEYLGEHTVKNITKPVKVYRVPMGPKAVIPEEKKEKKSKLKNWQWTALGLAGAIIIIIGALAIWNFYLRGPSIETEQAFVASDVEEGPKTIAVLPFVDISPEKDQEYFVDGLSEELLNCLSKIPDLLVTARTSSFTFKGSDKRVQEIANELGVAHILEGSVRKAGNALRITAQLIRAADGFHLWSGTYDRELKDIFAVQEDIARAVADELKVTLGIEDLLQPLGGTDNLEAYELFLVARGQINNEQFNQALESIDAAVTLDPKFVLAWVLMSYAHVRSALVEESADRASLGLDAGLNASLRAIELSPSQGKAYLSLGSIHTARGSFIEAGLAYRKGLELTTESIDYFDYGLTEHYAVVGYLRKHHEIIEELRLNDPLQPLLRGVYILSLCLMGDMGRVEEEYERGKAIFGDQWGTGDTFITVFRLGAKDVLYINDLPKSIRESMLADRIGAMVLEHLKSPEEGLAELYRIYSTDDNLSRQDFNTINLWAAYFGDPELALNAMERFISLSKSGLYYIWTPVMKEVRQLPRFKELMREIGLVDFWKEFGWPDLCRPKGDDDFECD
jgi:adenylate cyclase